MLRDAEGARVDARVGEIERSLRSNDKPRARDLFGGRFGLLPIVWAGIGLAFFQQLVGIDQFSSLLIGLSTSVINIVGTVVAMQLIDRIGRKPLALIGSAGMAVSLTLAAWVFSYKTGCGESCRSRTP